MPNKLYMQRKDNMTRELETVDEFPTTNRDERKEARRCVGEYHMADPWGTFYLSSRPCKAWSARK